MISKIDFPDKVDVTLSVASGVESVLKKELIRLNIEPKPAINGAITFNGSLLDVARCNINLRTADRVYIKLAEFIAYSFDELFEGVIEITWERYVDINGKILVNGKCVKSKLFSISDCQKIVKKAIVVRLQDKYKQGRLLEDGENYSIEFSIFKDVVSILLNTSGVGLHKRGYRDLVGIAPIKETLASALLLMSDYYYKNPFLDPFCGSGTIAIECAKIALNIAGGIGRTFDFNKWTGFDKKIFDEAYTQALDNEKRDREVEIFASDIDKKAIELAEHHAEKAGLKGKIKFSKKDVKNLSSTLSNGTIVTNPPYGERVYDRMEAEECYKGLRKAYDNLDNWSLFLITSHNRFEKIFGKKCDRERKLYNSNKECRYYYYYKDKEKI
jgi:putative N6-adenine-specific DNA methylase